MHVQGRDTVATACMLQYIRDEAHNQKHEEWDMSTWRTVYPKNIPRQTNHCDCGVFTLLYANYIAKELKFNFQQADMDCLRIKIVNDLMRMKVE